MGDEAKPAKPRVRPHFRKPRVKLNFSRNLAGALTSGDGPKTKPYMQGYDRELDSEDEETGEGMAFEEQLILRLPEGPGVNGELDQLRKTIKKRSTLPDTWFKFKDSRRAVFYIAGQPYSAKIVDLPCIVESHKTLDNKQIFKIADISQMLLVEHAVANESEAVEASSSRDANNAKVGFNVDDYIYPHGITPPMQWARKRRFRKRIHNRAIDTVEKEVENLLNDDRRAEKVEYEFVDPAEADAIEEEIANNKYEQEGSDQDGEGSQMHGSGDEDDEEGSRRGGDDDDENVDQVLAAELDAALAREHGGEGEESASNSENENEGSDEDRSRADSDLEDLWDDDENEDEGEDNVDENENEGEADADKDDDEGDGEEEAERRVRESQLEAECREIETLIRRKQHDIDATLNALIKSRHQQALRKLQVEFDLKKKHLQDIKQLRRAIREERAAEAEARAESAAAAATDKPDTPAGADAHASKAPEASGK
ncbi:hypothetical protein MOBT1_000651 [Malassezia obtusa]|uniref:TAFII55 protein conserved region domain-containing protein n=1 Tax=Malassezia obtusa TaxID=76774 RepID=A0AAF0IQW1_9BASI|nr:hypothetical protein MOBT1_000651 [Malassezia obtusa]